MTPTSNSIAVWTNVADGIGHVAYVENVVPDSTAATTTIVLSEANYASYLDFADVNNPGNAANPNALVPRWGGGYDYPMETFTQTQMLTHNYPELKLLGYIHSRARLQSHCRPAGHRRQFSDSGRLARAADLRNGRGGIDRGRCRLRSALQRPGSRRHDRPADRCRR